MTRPASNVEGKLPSENDKLPSLAISGSKTSPEDRCRDIVHQRHFWQ